MLLGVVAGKAEGHRHDREARRIVERRFVDAEPGAQADAGRIGEGFSGSMGAQARGLTRDA